MRIKKIYQGELPENKIVNEKIDSQTDTYSCDYINNLSFEGGNGVDELPIDSIVEYEGETVPDGWELVEGTESGERNYIQCELTDRLNIPDTNYVLVPFNNNLIMGGAFTYDESTNEVVIDPKSNIDKVKIHFHSVITAGGEQSVSCFEVLVYKNDEIVLIANESMELETSRTAVSVDRVVECVPGDRFRVEIKSYDNIFILLNTYGRTVFSLEDMTNVTNTTVVTEGNTPVNLGTVLYENSEGSNLDITLSEAMSNFEYVDITYGIATDKRIRRISGDTPAFSLDRLLVVDGYVYSRITTYNVSGADITVKSYALKYDTDGRVITEPADASPLAIFKVVGYSQAQNELIIEEKQPSAITAAYKPTSGSSNWTVPETAVATKYPINTVQSQIGDGLTLDTENNNIVVGKGISAVMVFVKSTYLSDVTGTDHSWATYINHNDASMAQSTFSPTANKFMNINNSVMLNVQEGDTINLSFYGEQGDQVGRNKNTNITVFEIPNTTVVNSNNEVVLYDNEEGTNGEVILSDSVANYKYIEIFHMNTAKKYCASQKIYNANNRGVDMQIMTTADAYNIYFQTCRADIVDNKITPVAYGNNWWKISSGTISVDATTNCVYIYRVVGYK